MVCASTIHMCDAGTFCAPAHCTRTHSMWSVFVYHTTRTVHELLFWKNRVAECMCRMTVRVWKMDSACPITYILTLFRCHGTIFGLLPKFYKCCQTANGILYLCCLDDTGQLHMYNTTPTHIVLAHTIRTFVVCWSVLLIIEQYWSFWHIICSSTSVMHYSIWGIQYMGIFTMGI